MGQTKVQESWCCWVLYFRFGISEWQRENCDYQFISTEYGIAYTGECFFNDRETVWKCLDLILKSLQRVKHCNKNSGANMKCSKIVSELESYRTAFNGFFLPHSDLESWNSTNHWCECSINELYSITLWKPCRCSRSCKKGIQWFFTGFAASWAFWTQTIEERHFLWSILDDDWAFGVDIWGCSICSWVGLKHVSLCWWLIYSCSFMMYIQVASQIFDN